MAWRFVVLALLASCGSTQHARGSSVETLAFSVKEANTWNYFFRRGPVAAHLLATSGAAPRIIVAFPAGNSGIGVWFEKPAAPVVLDVHGDLKAVERRDGMRGIQVELASSAPQLRATGVVMSSVRVLRDYANDRKLLPKEIVNEIQGAPLVIHRTTLDGAHHFELRVEPGPGAAATTDATGAIVLSGPPGFSFALTFLHDDPPLTPIPLDELLTAAAAPSERDRHALSFLTYREKMLAGSWRFLTYFGRDTLLSVRLLMPVLQPAAIEGALGAVLERLDPSGDVAHEEDIGEFAALRNLREGRGPKRDPIFDYKMVDDDLLLAPVLAHYALDTVEGRASDFVKRHAAEIRKNLDFVVARARAFAGSPVAANLIPLKPGLPVGDWRDSEAGLGGGRYAYDVNAVLAPAALAAAARLYPQVCDCAAQAREAAQLATAWRDKAPPLFRVELPLDRARTLLAAYAKEQGIPAQADALTGPLVFAALSLDADGKPVPVMHSDDGFALLFGAPPPAELERIAGALVRPFPAGLVTPVGMVIANPAFVTDDKLRATFARDRYHGAVIWSWQQAMMAAGLARQLERGDLPATARAQLVAAQKKLWDAIRASDSVRIAEHWSWSYASGKYDIYRFGEGGDAEANAAQLWSTVYLAVQPPK